MSRNKRRSENEFRFRIKGFFCVYCGELANSADHFPPYSATLGGFILPCCRECNSLAGTAFPFDFPARARHVAHQIRLRYHRFVETPEWSKAELRELGYNLRVSVKKAAEVRKRIQDRLSWNAISYLAMMPRTREFITFTNELLGDPGTQEVAFKKRFEVYSIENAPW